VPAEIGFDREKSRRAVAGIRAIIKGHTHTNPHKESPIDIGFQFRMKGAS
jgi:hypothetical protein